MFQGDFCDLPVLPDSQPAPGRERIKFMLVGSRRGIENVIHALYAKQFSEVQEWSRPMPTENPGEFVSIMVRMLRLE